MKLYRYLTGPDDASFCHRVTAALNNGWQLYGQPTLAYDQAKGHVVCGQAITNQGSARRVQAWQQAVGAVRIVMVGLGPTIHPTICSGVRGGLDPRDQPEDDVGIICWSRNAEHG